MWDGSGCTKTWTLKVSIWNIEMLLSREASHDLWRSGRDSQLASNNRLCILERFGSILLTLHIASNVLVLRVSRVCGLNLKDFEVQTRFSKACSAKHGHQMTSFKSSPQTPRNSLIWVSYWAMLISPFAMCISMQLRVPINQVSNHKTAMNCSGAKEHSEPLGQKAEEQEKRKRMK